MESSLDDFDETFEEEIEMDEDLLEEIPDEDEIEELPKQMVKSKVQTSIKESDLSMSVSHIDMEKENLNRLNNKAVQKIKNQMDRQFQENFITKGDPNFHYDKRADFEANESNEWDESLSEF